MFDFEAIFSISNHKTQISNKLIALNLVLIFASNYKKIARLTLKKLGMPSILLLY